MMIRAVRVGPVAAEILREAGEAEVIAVFERSAYVAAPVGILCLARAELGDGPLHVLLPPAPGFTGLTQVGITNGAKGTVDGHRLTLGKQFVLDFADAPVWAPPDWPSLQRDRLRETVGVVRRHAGSRCPDEGVSRLVLMPGAKPADRTAEAAAPVVADFRVALAGAVARGHLKSDLMRAATLLLGLGPGLTPSGDDLLGGVMLLLSAVGQTGLRDALWAAIVPEIDALTVEISAAHLAATADGLGAASVHALIAAMLAGDVAAVDVALTDVSAIGHSSGFDTIAGIVLGAECVLECGD